MPDFVLEKFVLDLVVVLAAGLAAGIVCRRLGVSLLVGYLIIGAVVGQGGLHLVSQENHELELLARVGAWMLLFSVGLEFSLDELKRMSRFLLVGGAAQMLLAGAPLSVLLRFMGMSWEAALLVGAAGAFSSTVLVFKSLAEYGESSTPHGRRAIAILLFQDIALAPLMLLLPLLSDAQNPTAGQFGWLIVKSALFVAGVAAARQAVLRWCVPALAELRSTELVVLFTLFLLSSACLIAARIELPAALGALAAGLVLSGNRLSVQIDALILPYRESFAAVFFVTLGTLFLPSAFLREPLLLSAGLILTLALKTLAGAAALRATGLPWKPSFGMGLGLAQLGEFSFLLVYTGAQVGVLEMSDYHRVLFIAMGTLILTPLLIRLGLRWTDEADADHADEWGGLDLDRGPVRRALVIGLGPIGRQVASRLETLGCDVCALDLSPINLQPYAQAGFPTIAGDACDPEVLRRAGVAHCDLAVVCVPDDPSAVDIVHTLRGGNRSLVTLVRCRFASSAAQLRRAGADQVISEEQVASGAIIRRCEEILARRASPED
ncbi:MAG: cation:proton antiporter [Planctomycetales bacterium]|nr:cation:proton antiporter [Planctomycetales bacterium]